MRDEHKEILTKMLGLERPYSAEIEPASWAEIYEAIGSLKARANQPMQIPFNTNGYGGCQPLTQTEPAYHYHNGIKCFNNPCYWAGT